MNLQDFKHNIYRVFCINTKPKIFENFDLDFSDKQKLDSFTDIYTLASKYKLVWDTKIKRNIGNLVGNEWEEIILDVDIQYNEFLFEENTILENINNKIHELQEFVETLPDNVSSDFTENFWNLLTKRIECRMSVLPIFDLLKLDNYSSCITHRINAIKNNIESYINTLQTLEEEHYKDLLVNNGIWEVLTKFLLK